MAALKPSIWTEMEEAPAGRWHGGRGEHAGPQGVALDRVTGEIDVALRRGASMAKGDDLDEERVQALFSSVSRGQPKIGFEKYYQAVNDAAREARESGGGGGGLPRSPACSASRPGSRGLRLTYPRRSTPLHGSAHSERRAALERARRPSCSRIGARAACRRRRRRPPNVRPRALAAHLLLLRVGDDGGRDERCWAARGAQARRGRGSAAAALASASIGSRFESSVATKRGRPFASNLWRPPSTVFVSVLISMYSTILFRLFAADRRTMPRSSAAHLGERGVVDGDDVGRTAKTSGRGEDGCGDELLDPLGDDAHRRAVDETRASGRGDAACCERRRPSRSLSIARASTVARVCRRRRRRAGRCGSDWVSRRIDTPSTRCARRAGGGRGLDEHVVGPFHRADRDWQDVDSWRRSHVRLHGNARTSSDLPAPI